MKQKRKVILVGLLVLVLTALLNRGTVLAAPPVIAANQTLTIPENSPIGFNPTPDSVQATDPEGGSLIYLVTGGTGSGVFLVDAGDGEISVLNSAALDREVTPSFTLQVRVTDSELLTAEGTVTILLLDESDEPPVMADQTFSVPENSSGGTTVGTIQVTDPDVSDSFEFSVTGGSGMGIFNVNENSGQITVANSGTLNHETNPSYTLLVTVEDNGGQTDMATMTINVTNVNEPPVVNDQVFAIDENSPNGTAVGTIVASDPENNPLTFSLSGDPPFAVNNTGQLTVSDSGRLDAEANSSFNFGVTVTDNNSASDTANITVNINNINDAPTTSGIADVVVNEGAPPTVINLYNAFDDDEDTDQQMVYTIQANSNEALFSSTTINAGTLTLNYAPGAGGIANITIRATDTGGKFVDTTFKVDINDAPTTSGIADFSVNEDAGNTQINLFNVFADAEDPDTALTYTIPGNTNPGLFDEVVITLPNLILNYAANANGKATITIRATDTGGLFVETDFEVTVIPVNDPPTTSGIDDVEVLEDAPNTVINLFTRFADVEDDDDEMTYAVVANDNPGLFENVGINPTIGTLTLDYKENTSGVANLAVRATDTGDAFVDASFKVTVDGVNDPPDVDPFSKTINEDTELNFTTADFASHFTDPEGTPLAAVRIGTLPANGMLRLGDTAVTPGQEIPAGQLGNLVFAPSNHFYGTTSFNWNGSDGELFATAPAQVTIHITPVNDPPVVTDINKSGNEGLVLSFARADFEAAFIDVDGDELKKIRIPTLPPNGTLTVNNLPVAANQEINVALLNNLKFTPDPGWSGETSFEWNGSDGALYANERAMVIINIQNVNDPPVIDLNGDQPGTGFAAVFNTNGGPVAIVSNNLTVSDPDNEMLQAATVTIGNRLDGTAEELTANQTGTLITVNFNSGNGVLTLNGPDTVANFQKVLRTVKYQNTASNPNTTERQISFTVFDGELESDAAIAAVEIFNPRIAIEVKPDIQTVLSGNTAVFTIYITNTGDVELLDLEIDAPQAPACESGFNIDSLEAGDSVDFTCSKAGVTARFDNEVTVTGRSVHGNTEVSDSDTAVVRVEDPRIEILVTPAAGSDAIPVGSNAILDVYVENTGPAELRNVVVTGLIRQNDSDDFEPFTNCDRDIGTLAFQSLPVEYQCTLPNVQQGFIVELTVTAFSVAGNTTIEQFDIAEVNVLDLEVAVSSVPFEILAGQPTNVQFNITVRNNGSKNVVLDSLLSKTVLGQPLHGDLMNPNNPLVTNNSCAVSGNRPVLDANGGQFACEYTIQITAQPPAYTVVIEATASDPDNELNKVAAQDDTIITVSNVQPVEVTLSADPASLVAPGGAARLNVFVKNNQASDLILQSVQDSVIGGLDGVGTCNFPSTIAPNSSYSCAYNVRIVGQQAGDSVTHTIMAMVGGQRYNDDATIQITARPIRRILLPVVTSGYVAGEPNNSVCTAQPVATNTNIFFLPDDQNDWYRFTLTEPANVVAHLNNFVPREGQLILYTGDCTAPTFLKNNGDNQPNKEVDLGLQPAGQYLIWVLTDVNFSTTQPYTLRIDVTEP